MIAVADPATVIVVRRRRPTREKKYHVTLVRAPLISREGSCPTTKPCPISGSLTSRLSASVGHEVEFLDGIAEGLNTVHRAEYPASDPGDRIQDLVSRIPARTQVIGFTSMFSAEWVLLRELIQACGRAFPTAPGGRRETLTAMPEYV